MKLSEEMLYEHARKAEELWLNSLLSDDKIPEHRFSNKFERKMRKLIRSQRRSPGLNQFLSASKRIAVIAFAILTKIILLRASFWPVEWSFLHFLLSSKE